MSFISYSSVVVKNISENLIESVDVWFYLSISSTSLSGGNWLNTPPTWEDGKYFWQKTITTFKDGSTSETNPVCVTGAKGETGSVGQGVESITPQYYLSTSKTAQTGGSWTEMQPSWESGKYVWTRTKIVYKNPTSTKYTTPICDTTWEAMQSQIDTVKESVQSVKLQVDENTKTISAKASQSDIETAINNYDGTTIKIIRDTVAEHTTSIGNITTKVSEVKTEVEKKADGSTVQTLSEKVAIMEQDSSSFKTTVEETYATKSELANSSSSIKSEWTQKAGEIEQKISDTNDNVNTLTTNLSGVTQRVTDAEGNVKILTSDLSGVAQRVEDAEGNISDIQGNVSGIEAEIKDVRGGQASLKLKVDELTTNISNANGIASSAKQTAESVQAEITNAKGDSTTLKARLEGIETEISNVESNSKSYTNQTANEIKSTVSQTYATKTALSDVNNDLTDSVNNLRGSINSTNETVSNIQNTQNETVLIVEENKEQISNLIQRADGFTMDFKTVSEIVKQINDEFVTERDERYKYIKFIDGEIWLGQEVEQGDDDFKLVIRNDRISFLQNNIEVAYISDNKLYITDAEITNSLKIGRFVWKIRSNGNMGVIWE